MGERIDARYDKQCPLIFFNQRVNEQQGEGDDNNHVPRLAEGLQKRSGAQKRNQKKRDKVFLPAMPLKHPPENQIQGRRK